jgi:short-subunit dehydrogenase
MKALITGASRGIGEEYAHRFAQLGYNLILTGRNEDLLRNISVKISDQYRVEVETLNVELANEEELEHLTEKIRACDDLHVLVNNAGFGSGTYFEEEAFDNIDTMIKVHVRAPLKLIHAALPGMKERGGGIIINVSSLGGKTPVPKSSVYSATKSFIQIFSETLHLETRNSNIIVQTLCPGFTRTHFHSRLGANGAQIENNGLIPWMTTEEVVNVSLKNLSKDKVVCVPGFWNKVLWFIAGILPRQIYYKIVSGLDKRSAADEKKQVKTSVASFSTGN